MRVQVAISLCCLFIGCYGASSSSSDSVTYVGCYNTSSLSRGLSHIMFDFSIVRCFELCSGLSSRYAGINRLDYSCYCINKSASDHISVEEPLCLVCPDDNSKTCGGNQTMSLYEVKTSKSLDMKIMVAWDHEVELLDVTVSSNKTLVHSLAPVTGVDYHYLRGEGYAAWEEQIYRFPLFGKAPVSPTLVANISSVCPVFAVDWVNDRLIRPVCEGNRNAIMMADLDFGHEEMLVDLAEDGHHHPWMKDIVVDPYNGLVFWIEGTSLMTIRLEGNDLRTVLTELPAKDVGNLAVDTATERVFFSGYVKEVANIFYTNYEGTNCHLLTSFSQDNQQVLSLSVFRSEVYLMSQFLYNNDVHLYKITTSEEGASKEDMMDVGKMVTQMRIFHPDMQSPARDVCMEGGCSHHCVVGSPAVRCLCPRRYELGPDGKTCERGGHESFFFKVVIGLGSVVFIVLAAGVLMCISDKLWSKVRPSIVRVTPNILRQPVLYKRGLDDANLI